MAPLNSSVETTKLSELHNCQRVAVGQWTLHGEGKSAFYRTQIEKNFADKLYICIFASINTLIVKFRRQTIVEFRQFLDMHHLVGNS